MSSLSRLLASVDASTVSVSIHISWSAANAELRAQAREMLQIWPWLHAIEQDAPHSQFEHMRHLTLAALASSSPPAWLIFSDDDDLWSPRRAELFLSECSNAPTNLRAVLCRRKARPGPTAGKVQLQPSGLAPSRASADVCDPAAAHDVSALLTSGRAVLCDSHNYVEQYEQGEARNAFHRAEYFDYAVRLEALAAFVRTAPTALLAHKLCDLAFTSWLKDMCPPRPFLPSPAGEWVYWYGQAHGSSSASQGLEVQAEERRLARRVRDASLFGSDEACAAFLAMLRQRLEQELVLLRGRLHPPVIAGLVPLQLVEGACTRQAEAVIRGHVLGTGAGATTDSWSAARIPRLQAWAQQQCRGPIASRLLAMLDFEALIDLKSFEVLPVSKACRSREEILGRLSAANALPPNPGLLRRGEMVPSSSPC